LKVEAVADRAQKPAAFILEQHGHNQIPEADRTMTVRQTAWFWLGTNANLFFVSVGVIALEIGLGLAEALIAVVLGTALFATVGLAAIPGVRSGVPTMTVTRAAFGPRGNIPHGLLAWAASVAFEAINCIFGVYAVLALVDVAGGGDPGTAGEVAAAIVILAASGIVAMYGHATMVYVQRFFAIALTLALVVVMAYTARDVNWTTRPDSSASTWVVVAGILAAGAVVASGPISYLFNGPDWTRYLPSRTPSRTVFWTVFLSSSTMALFLSVMGVLLASQVDMSDPIAGVEPLIPTWVFVLYILAAIGGSIANNVVAFYSSGLCLQSMGLPLKRYQATAVDTVVATAVVLYIVVVHDFSKALHNFVALLVVWLAPFASVWLTDGLMRRWRYEVDEIHNTGPQSRYWGHGGFNVAGCLALAVGIVVCVLTVNAPNFTGPASDALAGADLTWTLGPAASSLVYWGLARRRLA
jgi:purine-cytosine permease-like protein